MIQMTSRMSGFGAKLPANVGSIQALYFEGSSGEFSNGCIVLLREGNREAIRRLPLQVDGRPEFGATAKSGIELGVVKVYRVRETIIAIASETSNSIALLDVNSARSISPPIPLIDGSLLSELRMTSDTKHIIQLNNDGRILCTSH